MMLLVALCYWVISQEAQDGRQNHDLGGGKDAGAPSTISSQRGAGIWTLVFSYYCLFIHVLVFIFPVRACWSVWDITQSLRKAAQSKAMEEYKKTIVRRRVSLTSVSSSDTLTSETLASESNACLSTASEASDSEIETHTDVTEYPEEPVIHAIVIPNYKEEMDTLKETLEVLASHSRAQTCYDVGIPPDQDLKPALL
jgi:hypothetical protein